MASDPRLSGPSSASLSWGPWTGLSPALSLHVPMGVAMCACTALSQALEAVANSLKTLEPQAQPQAQGFGTPVDLRKVGQFYLRISFLFI